MQTPMETECKNCSNIFQGSFCPNCGQKIIQERYTLKHLSSLVFESFNFERGLLFTIKSLFINPGKLVNSYLEGKTKDFYNPLKYLILIAGIYAVLVIWFKIFETNVATTNEFLNEDAQGNKLQQTLIEFVRNYLSLINIAILPFYSLVSKWIFRKQKLYFAEHLVINGYLYAQYTLILMLVYLVLSTIPEVMRYAMPSAVIVFIAYYTYALRSVFKIGLFKSLLSSIVIFFLGAILFYIFLIIIMLTVIFILKLSGFDLKQLLQ